MEKRAAERFAMRIPVTLFVEDGMLERVLTLETENISSRGTFLPLDEPVPLGDRVELELYLPVDRLRVLLSPDDRVRLTVTGTVVRTQHGGIAVEFDRSFRMQPFRTLVDQVAGGGRPEVK